MVNLLLISSYTNRIIISAQICVFSETKHLDLERISADINHCSSILCGSERVFKEEEEEEEEDEG